MIHDLQHRIRWRNVARVVVVLAAVLLAVAWPRLKAAAVAPPPATPELTETRPQTQTLPATTPVRPAHTAAPARPRAVRRSRVRRHQAARVVVMAVAPAPRVVARPVPPPAPRPADPSAEFEPSS